MDMSGNVVFSICILYTVYLLLLRHYNAFIYFLMTNKGMIEACAI